MVSAARVPFQVSDFTVLPIKLPPVQSFPAEATHYLYLRRHEPKLPHPESARSIFLVNIPFDATEQHLRSLFADESLGGARVERVDFDGVQPASSSKRSSVREPRQPLRKTKKRKRGGAAEDSEELAPDLPEPWDRTLHRSGSSAVAVFVDRPSKEAALKMARRCAKKGTEIIWGEGTEDSVPPLGSQRYLTHLELVYPPKDTLQSAVDTYMTAYAAREQAHARARAVARSEPDAEGFITVTRGGRIGPAKRAEAEAKAAELKKKQEEKGKAMPDFYRFQVRERKKKEAGALLKKFDADRKRVDEMRRARKERFRPM